jgi:hypothetical protein
VTRPARAAQFPPATLFAGQAYDPATAAGVIAWQRSGGVAVVRRNGADVQLPGRAPALGGRTLAWLEGEQAVIADAASGTVRARLAAPGAGVLGVSDELLAWRGPDAEGRDAIYTRTLGPEPGPPQLLAGAPGRAELGRPAVLGAKVLFHVAGIGGSRLVLADPATGAQEILRRKPGAQLTNPVSDGLRLLYVHATGLQQELRLGPIVQSDGADLVIAVHPSSGRRDQEHEPRRARHAHPYMHPLPPFAKAGETQTLWSTALAPEAAYVTRLLARAGRPRRADILRVALPFGG